MMGLSDVTSWYEDLFQTLTKSLGFKFRWGEKGHIQNAYFKPTEAGVKSALKLVDELQHKDIMALSLWFKYKWGKFYFRRCHAIENYPAILNYFLARMSGRDEDARLL